MKIPKITKVIISLTLLIIIISFIGPKKLIDTISKINLIYLIPVILLYLSTFIVGAWNIDILLRGINKNIKFLKLVKYIIISWSLGLITPGKVGDFSIIYFLKKEKVKIGQGFAIILIDKAITVFVLLLFALLTAIILLTKKEAVLIIGVMILTITIGLLILTKKIRSIIKNKILREYSKKFKGFYKTIELIRKNNKKEITYNFILTIFKWFLSSIDVMLIFLALGSKANIFMITIISASLTILNLIPITFHGIGLKEGTGIYLYGLIGIPGEIVITSYITFNILAYGLAAIALYLLAGEIEKTKKISYI